MFPLFVVDVICAWGRRRARAKLGRIHFRSLCFLISLQRPMFRYLPPAPVITGRVCKRPLISTDERLEKKKIFDEKEGELLCHAPISLEAECISGIFMKYFWTNYVRNELDWGSRNHSNMEFSYAVAVMDKFGGWEKRKEDKNQIDARFGAFLWIFTKQLSRYGHKTRRGSCPSYIRLQRHSICLGTFSIHEWIQKSSQETRVMELSQDDILRSVHLCNGDCCATLLRAI